MGKTYLVTGGSGFLGFTVLRLLANSQSAKVSHVKILDLRFPPSMMDQVERAAKVTGVGFEWIEGDVSKVDDVLAAAKGCDTVLHIAAVIPGAANDDDATMWKINVGGTKNVVDSSLENEVTTLVYISSTSVIGPNLKREPAILLDEDGAYNINPTTWYGRCKRQGEKYVLEANGRENKGKKALITCALRPCVIYGEDFRGLRSIYKVAKWNNTLQAVWPADQRNSFVYVANLASAALQAAGQMQDKADLVGGQAYFVKDKTPDQALVRMQENIFSSIGFKLSKRQPFAPFWIVYLLFWLAGITYDILRYFGLSSERIPHRYYLWYMNSKFTVSNKKFVEHFDYEPPFSTEASLMNTTRYLKRLVEQDFASRLFEYDLEN